MGKTTCKGSGGEEVFVLESVQKNQQDCEIVPILAKVLSFLYKITAWELMLGAELVY